MTPILPIFTLLCSALLTTAEELPAKGLVLDLDAAKGLTLEDGDKVAAWRNQVAASPAKDFVKRDEGRNMVREARG